MPNQLKKILSESRNSWLILIQATAWIAAVIATFVMPPPIGTAAETRVWVRFAQFVITILIGLFVLLAMRWNKKKHILWWAAGASAFLVVGTVCFFSYQVLGTRWTAAYAKERVLIGDTFTRQAAEYAKTNPTLIPADLIMHYAGAVEKIWTIESINQRRFVLAGIYTVTVPIFTLCIISLLQAIQCATVERPARTRRRREPVAAG